MALQTVVDVDSAFYLWMLEIMFIHVTVVVFCESEFGKIISTNELSLPKCCPPINFQAVIFPFLGDEPFRLNTNHLRLFPRSSLRPDDLRI
jgi:hypothetical protein